MNEDAALPRRAKRRALGRGLDALLGETLSDVTDDRSPILVEVDPNSVAPNPEQPRRNFDADALASLAESIHIHGLLHPIIVERGDAGYALVAGERRLRAAQLAGIASIQAIVRPASESARQSLELALTENLNREDLNPIEEAAAYARLADTFGLSHEAIAMRLGRARPTISNAIRLLGLAPVVQEAVATGRILPSHARAIVALPDHRDQEALARDIQARPMTARDLEELVQVRLARPPRAAPAPRPRLPGPTLSADDEAVRRGLEQALGLPVALRRTRRGGDVVVSFASDEDLAALYSRLNAPPL